MTVTVWVLDPTHTTATALPPVEQVEADGFDTEGNYTVTGASTAHIIPVGFLYRVEKSF